MQAPAVTVRKTEKADRDTLVALAQATGFFNAEDMDIVREVLDDALAGKEEYQARSALLAGKLAGYVIYGRVPMTDATYDLYWIVVDSSLQRSGIGRVLLNVAETEARALGARWMLIETAGKGQYDPTHQFYRGCGYAVITEIPDFYAPGDSRIVFSKRFDQAVT